MSEQRLIDLRVATNAVGSIDTSRPRDDKDDIIEQAIAILDRLPTIEPPEVRGEWIDKDGSWFCSVCDSENCYAFNDVTGKQSDNFCPNCGCDMRGL